ncbi:RHS repeat-associated core domain-containing protein [Variovorax sp. J22R133]|uniref:RHS repeat-associated core domain-containing protein n=1 Tax=Variovorax brevis TaxID=3053503 RepID=UPI0025757D84|nr:RHS repeat-associated core domain-containing protein [Variovorax sp. J22R133]MDM0116519.1 RHS repeat-associated core domain-containing protein [Variovorax sp. J22R133]
MTPQQQEIEKRSNEPETAVVPLDQIKTESTGAAAKAVDDWLQSISGKVVTLERVATVAGAIPVIGNIMALVDAMGDVITLAKDKFQKEEDRFFTWVSLGINLIGIVPGAGGAARTSLRPTLILVRQKFKTSMHDIGDAVIVMLADHLNETLAGEIDKFVDEATNRLGPMLQEAGNKGEAVIGSWSAGLRKLANGQIFDASPLPAKPLHDPKKEYSNFLSAVWGALGEKAAAARAAALQELKLKGNAAFKALISDDIAASLRRSAGALDVVGKQVKDALQDQANAGKPKSIGWLLAQLKTAVAAFRLRRKGKPDGKIVNNTEKAELHVKGKKGQVDSVRKENVQDVGDANQCKSCPAPVGSPASISFATGSETFVHTDFTLPGHMPITWNRTYYSRLGAFDHPQHRASASVAPAYLGARWITPYTTRIEQASDGSLRYIAADGREHKFPRLAGPPADRPGQTGQSHHNLIEDFTLGRGHDGLLILSHGRDYVETFELAPQFIRSGKAHTQNKAVFYRLASQRTRAGHQTELAYRHPQGQLSDITSGDTHVSTALDEQGRIQSLWLVQEAQAVRQLAAYTYAERSDGSSDLVGAQDENEDRWSYQYLGAGQGASTHLISRYTDRTGRGMQLQWMHPDGFDHALTSANSHRAKAWREAADDGSFDITLIWNRHIRLSTVIDAMGAETLYYYDLEGYTYRIVHPAVTGADGKIYENEEWFFRDANKNVTTHIHPDGGKDSYTYDSRSNLLSHTRADHSTVHFAYDAQDNLTGIRDGEGHAWKRAYDGANLVEEIDPLGHKTEYSYNEHGLPVEITDAKGGKKKLTYDAAGQLTTYTDCSGKTSRWTYDERGRLLKATNAAGEATQYRYERGQLAQVTHPDGAYEHLRHDAEGRLVDHRDALERQTRYDYSAAGLIARRIDANGNTLAYGWDRLGRLATLENENGRVHSFAYDPVGQLISETHFDASRTHYHHDPASGALRQIAQADSLTRLSFDPLGRLTERQAGLYDKASGHIDPATLQTDSYAYDGNGRLTDARNAHIHLQWFHDPVGNVHSEHHHYRIDSNGRATTEPLTAVWQHRHDELGHRIRTVRPDGHALNWLTYGNGHVHGLMLDDEQALHIERDDLHREVRREQGNRIAEERQYDPAGRLKAQLLSRFQTPGQAATGSAFSLKRHYDYDRAGQLTGIGDSRRGALSYRYDPVGRLLQVNSRLGTETFAFDPASNMVDSGVQGDGETTTPARATHIHPVLDNLIKDYAGTHYDYDRRGNVVLRRHNGHTTRFHWNALGRLQESRSAQTRTTYLYDPLGRRIAKKSEPIIIEPGGAGSQWYASEYRRQTRERGLGTTLYGWDGDQMAWESDPLYLRTTHYVYEPGSFVPLLQATSRGDICQAMLRRPKHLATAYAGNDANYDLDRDPLYNGNYQPGIGEDGEGPSRLERVHYYQCDHLGTPMELTDAGGEIAWEASYRAWGEASITISEAARKAGIRNPIRFQGQYLDEETGLHYNRYRYYDPQSGRFVSQDPIRLAGGINLQQYAPNPVEWMDPLGLQKKATSRTEAQQKKCGATLTSNQARREALRRARIPLTAAPFAQRTASGLFSGRRAAPPGMEQYIYKVAQPYGGEDKVMVLSHHKADDVHPCAHWHVGEAKVLGQDGLPSASEKNGAWKYQTGGPVVEHI